MKLNLGAGPNWQHHGWHTLDHKLQKNEKYKIKGNLNKINLKNKICDLFLLVTVDTSHIFKFKMYFVKSIV